MKKLLLALAVCFAGFAGPEEAAAQCTGVFPANTLCGNLSGSPQPPAAFSASTSIVGPGSSTIGDVVCFANGTGNQLSDCKFRIYTPEQYGAVGDGVTDDTTALTNMCTAVSAAGPGGTILFGTNKTYLVNSGVTFSDNAIHSLCHFTAGGVTVEGSGATIKDGAQYTGATTLFYFILLDGGSQYKVNNISCLAQFPVSLPVAAVIGFGCVAGSVASQVLVANVKMNGGLMVVNVYGGQSSNNWTVINAYSTNAVYGVTTPGSAPNSYVSVTCVRIERCGFTYDTHTQEWHVMSKNAVANDFLISTTCSAPTQDLDLWYTYLARDSGVFGNTGLTFQVGCAGAIIRNIRAHIDVDMSGDNNIAAGPPVKMQKANGSLGSLVENVSINGNIRNVPAAFNSVGGYIISWNDAAGGSWAGETETSINIRNLTISNSDANTRMYVDLAPFAVGTDGFYLDHFTIPLTITWANDNALKRTFGPGVSISGALQNYGCNTVGGTTSTAQTSQAINTTQYYGIGGYGAGGSSGSIIFPVNGIATNLFVTADSAPGGVTDTATFIIGGGGGTLTCNITGGTASCSDLNTSHAQLVNAGESWFVRYVTGNGGSARSIAWSLKYCSLGG